MVEPDFQNNCFHGRVLGITDVITFDGATLDELTESFKNAVEGYLEHCQSTGKSPDKLYSGKFVLRIEPDLHRLATIYAKQHDMSLNSFVENCIQDSITRLQSNQSPEQGYSYSQPWRIGHSVSIARIEPLTTEPAEASQGPFE